MRILTIDDDMVNNLIMRENIKQIDPTIEVVDKMSLVDGIIFLRACKNSTQFPGFIFCDYNLPPYNGKDFIRIFQNFFHHHHPQTNVFLISAAVDNHHIPEINTYSFIGGFLDKLYFDENLQQILAGQAV